MIRVNLLPRRREAKKEGSNLWIAAVALMVIAEIVGIVILHAQKKKDLDAANNDNAVLQSSIDQMRARVKNHDAVKKELDEYKKREDAIAQLQSGRTGPTAIFLELSRILTPGKMPTSDPAQMEKLRLENPLALPSSKWDPHRLWLRSFREDNRTVTMSGIGKTNDDVAEFLRRLSVSRYFSDVKLVKTEEQQVKPPVGAPYTVIAFDMKAKVKY